MTDVINELREDVKNCISDPISCVARVRVLNAAVTEIERLRAEIASLRQVAGCVEIPLKTFADIKKDLKHGS